MVIWCSNSKRLINVEAVPPQVRREFPDAEHFRRILEGSEFTKNEEQR